MTATGAQRESTKPQRGRSDSLQKMLELEHIRKLERLQGHQSMPAATHPSHLAFQQVLQQQLNHGRPAQSPPKLKPFPTVHPAPPVKPIAPLQSRRRESSAQLPTQKPELPPSAMKAVRRATALPSLSISVPPPSNVKSEIDRGSERKESVEHKHKTVTFLDVDMVDEPTADDASSICHSPSWESFGQNKKKEKRIEAKMRKKEKEQAEKQAEKEAKSVKKKLAAKLSKAGPNTKASPPRPPNASRSISSPTVFVNEHLRSASAQAFYEPPPSIRPQHARQRSDSVAMQLKAALTGHKTHNQSHNNDDQGFIGGLKLEQKRQNDAGIPFRKPNPPSFLTGQRSHSFGPEVRVTPPAMTPSALPRSFSFDPQGERPDEYDEDSYGPKTPRSASINTSSWSQPLVSPTAPPVPDVSNFHQWMNGTKQSQVPANDDELEIHNGLSEVVVEQERGRRRESYVHQSRQQSRERSMNGYRDEVRVSAKSHYPPASNRPLQSRAYSSSSESSPMGSNFPPRNGSLSSLGGYKDQSASAEDFTLTFRLPYTPPAGSPGQQSFDRSTSQGPPMSRMMSREIPLPPERSASRERHPATPGAAIRSFKDAAKAAFQKVSTPGSSKPPVSNYFTRAARDTTMTPDSTSSSRYSTDEPSPFTAPPRPFAESTESTSRDSSARPTHRSSMSSCDESLPSPSPATTPNSSRPQSEKGLPPLDGELGRVDNETVVVTNDTRSYRLSHKAAMQTASPIATNQRISLPPQIPVQNHEAHLNELEALVTEKFGRKASVADAEDSDSSQSYPTPIHTDSSKTSAMATPLTSASLTSPYDYGKNGHVEEISSTNIEPVQEEVHSVVQRHPSLTKSRSSPDLALDTSFLPKLKHQPLVPRSLVPPPPPRSSKRGSVNNLHAKAASQSSFPADVASRKSIVSTKGPSNPSHYLEEARKSMPPPRSSRVSRASIVPPNGIPEPVAKMLVECCSCKFLHDMPSKVYECMAKPDSMVEDRKLGVSGLISTTVKCPWCAHGMTTNCCAGYAAVIYLKEKLH
ncbi:hypothetical protein CABS01_13958 [Colletotrichum abscissum]|uniref:Uncharacterized protein n=1 Tax=Colletotrichum abscissum TaxID=1671311 RepID=A0A9P9XDA1_9PEZI|nr:uncharacterized protein CABS01_13958 [Colletotrichum abscissum]KAI3547996.1 hypothetical protein CABS02_08464 [Colletotrichum abscissum]KAK1483806.1 hypothetical protein CABS01_13958 [Colletotrichum abscissum]